MADLNLYDHKDLNGSIWQTSFYPS